MVWTQHMYDCRPTGCLYLMLVIQIWVITAVSKYFTLVKYATTKSRSHKAWLSLSHKTAFQPQSLTTDQTLCFTMRHVWMAGRSCLQSCSWLFGCSTATAWQVGEQLCSILYSLSSKQIDDQFLFFWVLANKGFPYIWLTTNLGRLSHIIPI